MRLAKNDARKCSARHHPLGVSRFLIQMELVANYTHAAPEYVQMLRGTIDMIVDNFTGWSRARLCRECGISRAYLYAVLDDEPTLKQAVTIFECINRLFPALEIPPPSLPIRGAKDYRWSRVGQRLLDANPDRWDEMMAMLSRVLDAEEAVSLVRMADDESVRKK